MEMQQMIECLLTSLEQKMASRKAGQEHMQVVMAKIETDQEEIKQEIRAHQEHLMAMLNAHHERMMACLGKTEATDLKANPEEMESESEHQEVPQEVAAVKSLGTMKKQHLASSCRVLWEAKETDLRRLWILEEVCCHLQEDDLPCRSGMAKGTQLQGIQPGKCGARNPEKMDIWEETSAEAVMQQWHKELLHLKNGIRNRGLVTDKHESSQRCAAEIIVGIMQGAKHWPFHQVSALWKSLAPIICLVLLNMTVETVAD
jgi:hypothetical protein